MNEAAGVLAGIVVGFVTLNFHMALSTKLFPAPDNLDWSDKQQTKRFLGSLPPQAFLFVLLGHASAPFIASLVSTYICQSFLAAIVIGSFFLCAGILNLVVLPHPWWFAIMDTTMYVPAAILGFKLMCQEC